MSAPDEKDVDEAKAKAKGRDVSQIEVTSNEETFYMLCTAPSKAEYIRFLGELKTEDTGKLIRAQESFVKRCCLFPTLEEVDKLFDAKSVIAGKFAGELMKLAGSEATAVTKKL